MYLGFVPYLVNAELPKIINIVKSKLPKSVHKQMFIDVNIYFIRKILSLSLLIIWFKKIKIAAFVWKTAKIPFPNNLWQPELKNVARILNFFHVFCSLHIKVIYYICASAFETVALVILDSVEKKNRILNFEVVQM